MAGVQCIVGVVVAEAQRSLVDPGANFGFCSKCDVIFSGGFE